MRICVIGDTHVRDYWMDFVQENKDVILFSWVIIVIRVVLILMMLLMLYRIGDIIKIGDYTYNGYTDDKIGSPRKYLKYLELINKSEKMDKNPKSHKIITI